MEKSKFLREVENRYGFKIVNVYTCEDRDQNEYSLPDCLMFKWGVIPPNDCIERIVPNTENNLLSKISNSNDFYRLTQSGFNSFLHPCNEGKDDKVRLIPVVLIDLPKTKNEDFTLSFRIDNPMIREMFSDTEMIMTNNDGEGYDQEKLNHRFNEHKEYLDYFFIKRKGGDWIQTWFDKSEEDKQYLLHSEYLETKQEVSCN